MKRMHCQLERAIVLRPNARTAASCLHFKGRDGCSKRSCDVGTSRARSLSQNIGDTVFALQETLCLSAWPAALGTSDVRSHIGRTRWLS